MKMIRILVVLFVPALILLLYRISEGLVYTGPILGLIIIYLPSIIFCALVIWKKPCSLFFLPLGFLVSPLFDPLWMLLLERRYYFLFSSGHSAMTAALMSIAFIYALPFAIITLIIATITKKDHHKKN